MRDIKRTVVKVTCDVVEFVEGRLVELSPVELILDDENIDKDKLMEKMRKAVSKKYSNANTAIRSHKMETEVRKLSVENFMKYSEVIKPEEK